MDHRGGGLRQLPEVHPGANAGGEDRLGRRLVRSARPHPHREPATGHRARRHALRRQHEATGADASHRGGRPGFVRVVDEKRLRLADYAGNNMFQTPGNISRDPRVGLLFVDFASGATLQLTGRARILWDSTSFSDLPGAERAVEIEIDQVVELEGRVAGGSRLVAPSPFNP